MELKKWIFVIQPHDKTIKVNRITLRSFSKKVMESWAPALDLPGIVKIKVSLSEEMPPIFNLFGFRKETIVLFHLWGNINALNTAKTIVEKLEANCAIYEVNEFIPLDYKLPLKKSAKFPVPIVVTLLQKKIGLETQAFRDYWHQQYTPLAMGIIPLNLYIKSEVINTIQFNINEKVEGIVEETCFTKKQLLNPIHFFGGNILKLIPNLIKISKGVNNFLDLKKIKVYYLNEYFIKV